jgi:choline dehydrogenase-like flavoprotein
MLLDASLSDTVPAELSADLVIIGAGTVGLYLASLMAEAKPPLNIVVVEAGAKVAGTERNALSSTSVGKRHDGVHIGRAAGLGGTSSLWGGQLAEFDEADLARADAGWPISFDQLRQYYRQVYESLDIGKPESVDVYRKLFGDETDAVGDIERFFTYWLREPNFATLYQKIIRSSASVRVIVNLTANGFSFDGENARAVRCLTESGRKVSIQAQRFVFATGTIATSRFFLSTQRENCVPWASNPSIGCYFQDHLGGKVATVEVLDERRFRDYFENGWVNGVKLQPKLSLSRRRGDALRSGACGIFTFDSSISENLSNLKRMVRGMRSGVSFSSVTSRATDLLIVGRSMVPLVSRYLRNRRIFAVFDQGVSLNVQAEQIPIRRSCIRLTDRERLKDGLCPISVDWQCDGEEIDAIYSFATHSDVYLQRHGLARLTIEADLLRRDPAFLNTLRDTYHQCGGMRMSVWPVTGAVDPDGRVWGSTNVWVSGPAVFPSSSHANCTLTGLALAARLSKHLMQ